MDHTFYLPLRSTYSQLGPMLPLCLLLSLTFQQQQSPILCLCLVGFVHLYSQTELEIICTD